MTLLEIRTKFVDLSGRHDLVADQPAADYTDAGANWFIQAGQRLLDRLPFEGKDRFAKWRSTLSAGTYLLQSSALRAVKSVRIESSEGETAFLVKKPLGDLREQYADADGFANTDAGTPQYYSPWILRQSPTVGSAGDWDTESDRGILVLPPPDVDYTIEVEGLFLANPLVADTDESFWSIVMPETLVQAAWYELERFYRNTQGMADHMAAIERDLQGIDFDAAEEDIAGAFVMQDSWRF